MRSHSTFARMIVVGILSLAVVVSAQCPYNNALLPNGTCYPCGTYQYPDGNGGCANYRNKHDKLTADLAAPVDTGNTAWMLAASALVMIMTPALGMFYGGLCGANNVNNTIMMSFSALSTISLAWVLFGYSFAFGDGNGRFGMGKWGALMGIGKVPSAVYGANIPHSIFVAFQCMFAQITPALISGAVIGRMKFWSYTLFILIWSIVIYDPLAQWMWSWTINDDGELVPLGWLGKLGAIDFAGGSVIHISSGFSGLAAAIVVGRRTNPDQVKPHNVPMVMTGAALLWFGWFGFNAGSAGAANGVAAMAFLNTHIATAAAVMTWMVIESIHKKQQTCVGAATAIVIGLVCITPGCGFVTPMASIAFGIVPVIICYAALELRTMFCLDLFDDTLEAFTCHGIGGMVGCFLTGLFASSNVNGVDGAFYGRSILLGYQMASIVVSASFSFFGTIAILLLLKFTIGIRVSEEEERLGMDVAHGEAYSMHPYPNEPLPAKSGSDQELKPVNGIVPVSEAQPATSPIRAA